MVMEVLTLILDHMVTSSLNFRFHNKCEKQRIVNLCFADDLFLFTRGEVKSVKPVLEGLDRFKKWSGLVPSIPKSTVYFANVADQVKQNILALLSFKEGCLPVRYLGVPLISTRLMYKDCKVLVERMENMITHEGNKYLSFAGRLQLIRAVLSSLHVYWASVFILPQRVIKDLEKKMRDFLWSNGPLGKGKSKVAWKTVCLPASEGGLGIKRICDVNRALMVYHMWNIITNRESLWVKWIHTYKLRQRSFWDIPLKQGSSWGWRKLMKLRTNVRNHIWSKIGDMKLTSAWFDKWSVVDPIGNIVTPRMIKQAGFHLDSTVADVVRDGRWTWPLAWLELYPALTHVQPPNLKPNVKDTHVWIDNDGKQVTYSAKSVWDTIRNHNHPVPWQNIVWFSQCIPRHAFLMWLVIGERLKTQDKLKDWDVSGGTNLRLVCCPLCQYGNDSHPHLFFECAFSSQVWLNVKRLGVMDHLSDKWENIMDYLISITKSKSAKSIIGRMIVAATAYHIWQERNTRLFSDKKRSVNQVVEAIACTVCLKLITLKFKHTRQVELIINKWRLPKGVIIQDEFR
ncbi:putative RNA-directed DNA polymerase [Helianthus annuus]|nr:putative RNA-directed DNA polymerase [Helianthus annuus]